MKIARQKIDQLLEQRRAVGSVLKKEQTNREVLLIKTKEIDSAQQIIQLVTKTIQEKCHVRIASIVTRCLNAVLEDPYEFRMVFEQKRGKTEAKLVFTRNGIVLDEPLDEVGGGVIDVAALGLRMACMLIQRPPVRRLLVMDEPFSHIRGIENRNRTRKMLLRLAEELGIQIVLCTDIEDFRLGKIVEMG